MEGLLRLSIDRLVLHSGLLSGKHLSACIDASWSVYIPFSGPPLTPPPPTLSLFLLIYHTIPHSFFLFLFPNICLWQKKFKSPYSTLPRSLCLTFLSNPCTPCIQPCACCDSDNTARTRYITVIANMTTSALYAFASSKASPLRMTFPILSRHDSWPSLMELGQGRAWSTEQQMHSWLL